MAIEGHLQRPSISVDLGPQDPDPEGLVPLTLAELEPVHDLISWPSGQLERPDLMEIRMVAARFGPREATMPANPALAASSLPVMEAVRDGPVGRIARAATLLLRLTDLKRWAAELAPYFNKEASAVFLRGSDERPSYEDLLNLPFALAEEFGGYGGCPFELGQPDGFLYAGSGTNLHGEMNFRSQSHLGP